jgi:SAM-dependent methyltransferase
VTETFRFYEFEVPEHLSVFVGSIGAVFGIVAEEQLALLHRYIGLSPDQVIIEVGCGVGKAAIPIAKLLSGSGSYLGMDVSKEAIQWCQDNVTPKYPNVRFVHLDAKSSMYNASGQLPAAMIRLPIDDHSVDRIFLMSVFTHMLEADVRHYLAEFKRIMKPGALVLATWFIVDDGVLESARAKRSPLGDLRFEHAVSDGCYVNDLNEPLGAVAYKRQAVDKMVSSSGLTIEKAVHGYWSHYWGPSDTGQDITILQAGHLTPVFRSVQTFARRVVHRVWQRGTS